MDIIQETISIFKFEIDIDKYEKLKEIDSYMFDQDCTIYQYFKKDIDTIILKIGNQCKGFYKNSLLDKYKQSRNLFSESKELIFSYENFLNDDNKLYEVLDISDKEQYIIPYEVNAFVKKCKST